MYKQSDSVVMVLCLFVNCGARTGRDSDVSFYRVPTIDTYHGEEAEMLSTERRTRWIAAISRDDLTEKILTNDRVCSRHFVSGRPAKNWDKFNVDWVPTLNLGHSKRIEKDDQIAAQDRAERAKVRRKKKAEQEASLQQEIETKKLRLNDSGATVSSLTFTDVGNDFVPTTVQINQNEESFADQKIGPNEKTCQTEIKPTREMCTQTSVPRNQKKYDACSQTDDFDYLFTSNKKVIEFDEDYFTNSDDKVLFYTGLPSYHVLNFVFELVLPFVSRRSQGLSPFQELVMIMIKLRLDVPFQDLAYRFNVSVSTVSRVFHSWLEAMDTSLSKFVHWPCRDSLLATMPQCFRFSFGTKTTVIIDCFEIFIEKPSNLLARAQTFSSYKHHNTIKVLIGITPQGTISYVSEAWGGRTSDKFLTENCGILDKLVPGDMVMADRGFTIHESVAFKRASLVIPAFTKGKDQLDPVDVEKTRGIASVRIHVERVIGLLRSKYTILQGTLPTDFLMSNCYGPLEDKTPVIDRVIKVCSALVNLCPPIIPFD